ncbi:hypothetical protein BT96DRAFT_385824 [Gymnopus androsaceus JB14]|uniref:Uncharacterized protein n=1 Tax=Gymnopus androsaceus JB14 TaxID=1447944 RepID=A0A6A4I8C1_9AGAR|nr:hypothetical protein BT96DRAFT_385824 [Gymnopus androsaceus JB14]
MQAIIVVAYFIDIVSSWSSMETIEVLAHYSSSLMISPIIASMIFIGILSAGKVNTSDFQ